MPGAGPARRDYRIAGIEIFDQPGGCVPLVAMVPVYGGVGDVLAVGVLQAGPPDQSRKRAVRDWRNVLSGLRST